MRRTTYVEKLAARYPSARVVSTGLKLIMSWPILIVLIVENNKQSVTITKLMAAKVNDPLGWSSALRNIQSGIDV